MKNDAGHSIIPEHELRCQWMDAGVVEYKLCDKNFQCDQCPYDAQLRGGHAAAAHNASAVNEDAPCRQVLAGNFQSVLKQRLDILSALPVEEDRLYHRNHLWMLSLEKNVHRVGIDAVAANLLQPIMSIVISRVPAEMQRFDPCCWIILSEGAVSFRSPADGVLLRFNPAIVHQPSLITADPFGEGWIAEFSIKNRAKGLSDFYKPLDVKEIHHRNLVHLQHQFEEAYKQSQPSVGITMNDGGIPVTNIETILGTKVYFDIVSRIVNSIT